MCREVDCLRHLVDPASLEDWRCSYLCSELIPSVTERLALFVKELSFPQTAPTDDGFFNRDWAGACWGHWAGTRAAVGLVHRLRRCAPLQRQERRRVGEGFARGRSDAEVSSSLGEKIDYLKGECFFLRTFHRGGGLIYIAYVFPIGW